ncbi:MAG: hypothetical protein AAFX87_27975, partial [Bacteroidota bacterium]
MKSYHITTICLSLILILNACSSENKNGKSYITIQSLEADSVHVIIFKNTPYTLESDTICDSLFIADNGLVIEVDLQEPTFATFIFNGQQDEIYIEPNRSLDIHLTGQQKLSIDYFTNNGAVVNNHWNGVAAILKSNLGAIKHNIIALNPNEFLDWSDTLSRQLDYYHQHFIDTAGINQEDLLLIQNRYEVALTSFYLQYVLIKASVLAENPDSLAARLDEQITEGMPYNEK